MTDEALSTSAASEFRLEEDEQRIVIDAASLRLTFLKAGERWVHVLEIAELGTDSGFREVAQTVESEIEGGDPTRVVSPAYQEIQIQPMAGGVRLLLTGQLTPHHFSAVLTVSREGDGIVVEFDVADRCRGPILALASTYLIPLGSGALIDANASHVVWGGESLGHGQLEFITLQSGTTALAEAGRRGARVQALAPLATATATQRLLYRWRWTPATSTKNRRIAEAIP